MGETMILSNGRIAGYKRQGRHVTSEYWSPRHTWERGCAAQSLPISEDVSPDPRDLRPQDYPSLADLQLWQCLPIRSSKPFAENYFGALKGHLRVSRYEIYPRGEAMRVGKVFWGASGCRVLMNRAMDWLDGPDARYTLGTAEADPSRSVARGKRSSVGSIPWENRQRRSVASRFGDCGAAVCGRDVGKRAATVHCKGECAQ